MVQGSSIVGHGLAREHEVQNVCRSPADGPIVPSAPCVVGRKGWNPEAAYVPWEDRRFTVTQQVLILGQTFGQV